MAREIVAVEGPGVHPLEEWARQQQGSALLRQRIRRSRPKVQEERALHRALDEVHLTINPDEAVAAFGVFRQVIDRHMTLSETAEAANAAEAYKPLKVTVEPKAHVDEQEIANLRAAQTALGPQWRALAEPPSYQIDEAHLTAVITKAAAKLPPEIGRQPPFMFAMLAHGVAV